MTSNRILIVDNERDVLEGWERALRLAGFSVSSALTPKEALQQCDEHLFDLVILDFLMPSMDGVELLGRIRKKLPLVRSIIISGKIDEDNEEENISGVLREKVEADRYLHKSLANDKLKSAVQELLSQPASPRTWKDMARRAGEVQKVTVKGSRQVSKELRKLIKDPRKNKK